MCPFNSRNNLQKIVTHIKTHFPTSINLCNMEPVETLNALWSMERKKNCIQQVITEVVKKVQQT